MMIVPIPRGFLISTLCGFWIGRDGYVARRQSQAAPFGAYGEAQRVLDRLRLADEAHEHLLP